MNKKLVLPILLSLALVSHIKASDYTAAKAALTKEDYDYARGTIIEGYEHLTPAEFAEVIRKAPIASSASIYSPYKKSFESQWTEYNRLASLPVSQLIKASTASAFTAGAGTGAGTSIVTGASSDRPSASTGATKPVSRIKPGSIADETRLIDVLSPDLAMQSRASTCEPTTSASCASIMPTSTCTISESARLSSTTTGFGSSPKRLISISAYLKDAALKNASLK